ncbi:glycosyltransferase family 2 protein [Dermabacteraceae bacterium TAE3-ERU27]|nr:glycosyltransferase family 2 protein [Dermabacteraceae bacterium TAE3-ERU27]
MPKKIHDSQGKSFLQLVASGLKLSLRVLSLDFENRSVARDVKKCMHIPDLPRVKGGVWAISVIKNEADVIGLSIQNLLSQGVDAILVMDNGSTDNSADVVKSFFHTGKVFLGEDSLFAHEQAEKITFLSRLVTSLGARWIIPFDADELWFGAHSPLAESLKKSRFPIQRAKVANLYPMSLAGDRWGVDVTAFRTLESVHRKVAFKPFPLLRVCAGNHWVIRPGSEGVDIRILHIPWRSPEQLTRKLVQGAAALEAASVPEDEGVHWRAYGDLGLEQGVDAWNKIVEGTLMPNMVWQPEGKLFPFDIKSMKSWDDVQAVIDSAQRED